jgi:DNA-binding response OmpR family regulator
VQGVVVERELRAPIGCCRGGAMSDYQSILFVEDEDLIRELNAEELAEAGFELVVVESGDDALEALDNDAEPFCALVTDVNLGDGADGWDVGKRARELDDKIPVIYVSGASADEWQTKGVPNSVILDKPFTPSQLVAAIRSLLKKMGRHC